MKQKTTNTDCNSQQMIFQGLGRKKVEADFNGGTITSDGGAVLLREIDQKYNIIKDFGNCFTDYRDPKKIEHTVSELLSQRIMGICLGYEDLNDHDELRYDPMIATICNKSDPLGNDRKDIRDKGKALAGKSTLNRLELTAVNAGKNTMYKKIVANDLSIREFFVSQFLKKYPEPPEEIIFDVDATDDPLHGKQEGRFFHGYYDCYCYLPLYIFCGEDILCATLRKADIDASAGTIEELAFIVKIIREHWPEVQIVIRGDSGFCREEIMQFCEENDLKYIFGLARNIRLYRKIGKKMKKVRRKYTKTMTGQKSYKVLQYKTRNSWSRKRKVIAKIEYLPKGENPRFIVTNLSEQDGKHLYEKVYCARGDMENRIKEQQLYLFADRTSTHTFRANQIRLWFASVAYVLMSYLRYFGLTGTELEKAQCQTIRLKLFKIGAQFKVSVRRIFISMAECCPFKRIFYQVYNNLRLLPGCR
jgi:hypothetical protein